MSEIREQLKEVADKYGIQIIYAFGSMAKGALDPVEGKIEGLSAGRSDLDIGIKPEKSII